jgi:SAM-dependent methyltransferase
MDNLVNLNDRRQNDSWSDVESSGIINLISNYNLAHVITAFYKIGIIPKLLTAQVIKSEDYKLDGYLLEHTFRYLEIHGLLISSEEGYYLSSRGKAVFSDESIAQLCFYTESYGNIVKNIDRFLTKEIKYGEDIERDGKSLGIQCDVLFKEYHLPTIISAIREFGGEKIIDVGCGGGKFLIDFCTNTPNLSAIGIDISEAAIDHARECCRKAKLDDRLKFVVANAFELNTWPEACFDADILCGSGVIHESFRDGEEAVIEILNVYSDLLAQKGFKAIILGEPEIRHDLVKNDSDLYLVHIYTAQGFPRYRDEWLTLFEKTNLKCESVYTRLSAGPRFNFFVLTLK